MHSRQIRLQDFSISGVAGDVPIGGAGAAGQALMEKLAALKDKITDVTDPETLVSLQTNWDEKARTYTQIYGFPVRGDGVYPDDTVLRVHVAGGPYTVFTAVGPLPQAQAQAWKEIARIRAHPKWRITGNVSFELYGPKSRQEPPEVEIYVPGLLDQPSS